MKREKLLKSKGYNVTKIQNELFRQLTQYLKDKKINRTQFAKELGVSKGYVSQILNGDFDYKLSKLVELSLAIGKVPSINFLDVEEVLAQESNNHLKLVNLAEHSLSYKVPKTKIGRINFQQNTTVLPKLKLVN